MVLEKLRSEILEVADLALKYAKDMSIQTAEAYIIKNSITEVKYSKGKTECRDGMLQGIGIRVAEGKKVGFATCAGFAPDSIKSTLANAHKIAKNCPEDPRFSGFISESKPGKEGILDTNITELDSETLVGHLAGLVKETDIDDQRLVGADIEVGTQWGGFAVATTEGCLVSSLNTAHYGTVYSVAMGQGERSTAFDFKVGRTIQELSGLGTNAINKAFKHLGSKPLGESLKIPTIWEPLTASMLLSTTFQVGLDGGTVVEKQNPLMHKMNEQIATKDFQLNDDGTIPTKISSEAVDAEGTTIGKTEIVKDGVLKSFLFDNFYGPIFGTKSTGNAQRDEPTRYENIPSIAPNKLVLQPGTKNKDEQIAAYDKAIFIEGFPMGMGHSNMITGDFSITATNAYLVEKGEIVHPLKPVSIAGNFFESLIKIQHIGSDPVDLPFPLESSTLTIDDHTVSG
ncbi:MAG: TldD/PmbA family protein [Candidatus Heimdallarchaeota archaeon]|nr:TldD/PmbA family protein [Candidatus Heimdallarchaeota archaeon]